MGLEGGGRKWWISSQVQPTDTVLGMGLDEQVREKKWNIHLLYWKAGKTRAFGLELAIRNLAFILIDWPTFRMKL